MIIFDWDGTLCDSVAQIVRSVQGVAREMGLPVPSEAEAANIIGLSLPPGDGGVVPRGAACRA